MWSIPATALTSPYRLTRPVASIALGGCVITSLASLSG
jgi:hypothetical protein